MKTFPVHREIADQIRMILGVLGVYLMIFGTIAAIWSVRAAWGQHEYASLLLRPRPADETLQAARHSFRLYSRNYALCIKAAETACQAMGVATNADGAAHYEREADYWVSRGLNLNPWLMELHYLKARLLAKESPQKALEAWQAYVDWHFWDPGNLDLLAEFQEAAGRKDEAVKTRALRGRLHLDRPGL